MNTKKEIKKASILSHFFKPIKNSDIFRKDGRLYKYENNKVIDVTKIYKINE